MKKELRKLIREPLFSAAETWGLIACGIVIGWLLYGATKPFYHRGWRDGYRFRSQEATAAFRATPAPDENATGRPQTGMEFTSTTVYLIREEGAPAWHIPEGAGHD